MKRILVQIDGSNFYNKVKKIAPRIHLTNYKYFNLASYIAKTKNIHVTYYVGEVKKYPQNKKSEKLYASQQSLLSNLRRQNINIKLGYLLMSDGVFHEKGVDVQIAADMVQGALKNTYDIFYLVSSDTDLLPAIEIVQKENKPVIYIGFNHFISRALLNNCSASYILKQSEILNFI